MDIKTILIYLSMFEVSNKKMQNIAEIVSGLDISSISDMLNNSKVSEILSSDEYHKMLADESFENYLANLQKDNIKTISIYDEDYPESFKYLPDAPMLLYYKGDISLLREHTIAVVGTREPTNYGRIITENFVKVLAEAGVVILSGLAYGVDSIAHRKALEVGGKTVAVLGGGFNNIYPAAHKDLAKEIEDKGLLLSEYAPFVGCSKYTFPKRNRIIAGLSNGVLIPEAGLKSGTIHTKEYALEYGKDIFTIPGNINSSKSDLPNMLIKSAQAMCVTSGKDILEYYGIEVSAATKTNRATQNVSIEEQIILNLLKDGEMDFDSLQEKSKISVNILNSCLTTLEIRGLIKKLPAKTYIMI